MPAPLPAKLHEKSSSLCDLKSISCTPKLRAGRLPGHIRDFLRGPVKDDTRALGPQRVPGPGSELFKISRPLKEELDMDCQQLFRSSKVLGSSRVYDGLPAPQPRLDFGA